MASVHHGAAVVPVETMSVEQMDVVVARSELSMVQRLQAPPPSLSVLTCTCTAHHHLTSMQQPDSRWPHQKPLELLSRSCMNMHGSRPKQPSCAGALVSAVAGRSVMLCWHLLPWLCPQADTNLLQGRCMSCMIHHRCSLCMLLQCFVHEWHSCTATHPLKCVFSTQAIAGL